MSNVHYLKKHSYHGLIRFSPERLSTCFEQRLEAWYEKDIEISDNAT